MQQKNDVVKTIQEAKNIVASRPTPEQSVAALEKIVADNAENSKSLRSTSPELQIKKEEVVTKIEDAIPSTKEQVKTVKVYPVYDAISLAVGHVKSAIFDMYSYLFSKKSTPEVKIQIRDAKFR